MKNIILSIIVITILTIGYFLTKQSNEDYYKHMCATYGYQADCKTPLAESEKLK